MSRASFVERYPVFTTRIACIVFSLCTLLWFVLPSDFRLPYPVRWAL